MIRSYLTCETLFAISKGSRLTLNNITLITIKNCLANSKKVSNINGTFTIIAFWLSMTLIFFSFSLLSFSTAGSSRCVYCAHEDRSSPHSCTKETTLSPHVFTSFSNSWDWPDQLSFYHLILAHRAHYLLLNPITDLDLC